MAAKTQTFLSAEEILAFDDRQTEIVHVPEWRTSVRIRTMTAKERDELEAPMVEATAKGKDATFSNFRARIVSLVCINEDGSRMFKRGQVEALGEKNSAAISRIADAAIALSQITPDEAAELGKDTAPMNGSGSVSS